jgi:hypothetical protein
MMPILSYFAVAGSVLVALLFVADATLEKSGPLPFNNESVGLPKPWQPDTKGSILAATSAPEPDMTSAAVRAATPPAPQGAAVPTAAAAAKAEAAEVVPERTPKAEPVRTAKAEPAPRKQRRVAAHKQPRPDGDRRNYAWSRNGGGNDFFSGGNSLFGRF